MALKRMREEPEKVAFASTVESHLVDSSPYDAQYAPAEKMRAVVVENFPALGKAAAFRFLEWVQENPQGVCSLPTGKTPEYFIKWVKKILAEWNTPAMQRAITRNGLKLEKPTLSDLTFAQIDEFYPIAPTQQNSFYWYVMEYYIKGFGMDPAKALLIDCSKIGLGGNLPQRFGPTGEPEDAMKTDSLEDVFPDGRVDTTLRMRDPTTRLERLQQRVIREVDQWCAEYEAKIRALGGIGFFMGGIGPDGHVAFNCMGCPHHSVTRLDELNYPSQAAAAGDLGGIEVVRKRKVITIGLGTITFNPQCVAITCAAGDVGRKDVNVWGYRNVWFRFEPYEVSTIIPVSLQTISTLNHMFLNSFESQRDAEFPAYEIQGPFCAMSQRVQVEQYNVVETCLGYEWFHKHPSPLIRATRGLVYLREMTVSQLLAESRALRKQTENA